MTPVLGQSAETLEAGELGLTASVAVAREGSLAHRSSFEVPEEIAQAPRGVGEQEPRVEQRELWEWSAWDRARLRVGLGAGFELQAEGSLSALLHLGYGGALVWQFIDSDAVDMAMDVGGRRMDVFFEDLEGEGGDYGADLWGVYARAIVTVRPTKRWAVSFAPTVARTWLAAQANVIQAQWSDTRVVGEGQDAAVAGTYTERVIAVERQERESVSWGGTVAVHYSGQSGYFDARRGASAYPYMITAELTVMHTPSAYGLPAFWTFQPAVSFGGWNHVSKPQ